MQTPIEPFFQFVGEHIQAFAWRIETAFGGLPEDVLARKVIRGLTPSILWSMPKRKNRWTLHDLFWYADNLDKFLPADDPHWKGCVNGLPDFKLVCKNDDATPSKAERKERKPASSRVQCYKCQLFGHFARKCDKPRVKKTIVKNK